MLKRNYDIYISKASNLSANSTNTVKLLVKDFSFNRPASLDKVSKNTISLTQERTVDPYISTVAPVTFSLITYITPLVDTNVTSPEEYLWTSLMGSDTIAGSPNSTPTSSTINFSEGNVGSLHELTLWFDDPNNSDISYRIDNAIIDNATINFDINSIATIEWSGRGLVLSRDNTPPTFTDRTNVSECLKNKLSTITLLLAGEAGYTVALTGGSIEFNNNNTFHGRVKLGETTVPVGHYTGNREISGTLQFYLRHGASLSADLYDIILVNAHTTDYETSLYATIVINIGGTAVPYIKITVPRSILEIPRIKFDEAITMEVPFLAQEGTGEYVSINYFV